MTIANMGLDLSFEILEGQHLHPDLEDPDLLVKFSGPDVDILLANKAELLLALELLTMEVLAHAGRASFAAVLRLPTITAPCGSRSCGSAR